MMQFDNVLDFHDFCQVLSGIVKDPDTYKKIRAILENHGWHVSTDNENGVQISISGRPISIREAYRIFEQNKSLHSDVYNRTMDIWR